MIILITGGAGFVGSSIAIKLKIKYPNYQFIVFDNLKRRGSELNLVDFKELGIEFIHGDIRNKEDLASIPHFDLMIEASAEPSVMSGLDGDPSYVINNNLYGSINCFNLCVKYGAKLIFLSTSRVYPIDIIESANFFEDETRFSFSNEQSFVGISQKGISETLSIDGARSFYGTTKLSGEQFVQEYVSFYGLEAAITRFGVIAGARQMGKTDQGVVTLWMARHFWKQPLKYIGYGGLGKQVRDVLHIDDLVDLIEIQIHQLEKFKNRIYNAGGGLFSSVSLKEMSYICENITGNKIVKESILENRLADLRIYISDNTKIESEVGWSPKRNIETIFSDIFLWIKSNENKLKGILN